MISSIGVKAIKKKIFDYSVHFFSFLFYPSILLHPFEMAEQKAKNLRKLEKLENFSIL
jgi:hypothetical protein